MSNGQEWLEVESLDLEAQGVAHRRAEGEGAGKVVFIEGALPGERVQCNVSRKKNNWEQGQMSALARESSQRVRPGCPHFGLHAGACGGCKMQHLHPAAQVAVKQRVLEDNLKHLAKVRPERLLRPIEGPAWGYRWRARLSVRYVIKKGVVLVGFHERKSRYVADMSVCPVLPPAVSAMLLPLRELIGGDGPARPPAADRAGRGRRGDGAGAAPPGAAVGRRPRAAAHLRRRARRAVVAAAQGARHRAPLDGAGRSWPTRCPSSACACPSSRPTSRRSTRTSTACW
jgi:predicted RNA-binding protein with TRAM domain